MTIRNKLKLFKLTRDELLFSEIEDHFNAKSKCSNCCESIIFPNTFLRISKAGKIKYEGTSCKTHKIINKLTYNLSYCDKCMYEKFGSEYNNLNKSRIFNTLNKFTKYAFKIPTKIYNLEKSTGFGAGVSKDILIKRHGKIEGQLKWDEYREKQAYTNTFKHKREKFGWNKEQFNKFNKSRAVTLNNLISKYGKNDGYSRWNSYLERQSYTCSYEYFIEEYGVNEGNKKWDNFTSSIFFKNVNYSKASQELFNAIDFIFNKKYKTYYALKGGEFNKRINGNIIFIDYFINNINIAIEYNGDKFHANPKIYSKDSKPCPFNNTLASEIWKNDLNRYNSLYKEHEIKTLVIWSSDTVNISELEGIINKLITQKNNYGYYNELCK